LVGVCPWLRRKPSLKPMILLRAVFLIADSRCEQDIDVEKQK
jgi:hypothetical protein